MNQAALCAGTYDPITYGHLDVIERAARIFPRVVIAVAPSHGKDPLFPVEQRVELVKSCTAHLTGIEVEVFEGLLVDFAKSKDIHVMVRGLRAFSDFEYEFQMALTNRKLSPEVETLFLMPKQDYSYVSSSNVRTVSKLGGDISQFVPPPVQQALKERFG